MINTITITTSTDTNGDARVLMIEHLNTIVQHIANGRDGGNSLMGSIEAEGYEVSRKWEITEEQ